MIEYCVGLVTVPQGRCAKKLARQIVERQLAACVNIVPAVQSVFRWRGKVEQARETLLIMKTRKSLAHQLTAYVVQHHPYDVPEVIFLPLISGYKPYLSWLKNETRSPLS